MRIKQENSKFGASLGYIMTFCLKKQTKQKKKKGERERKEN
jgi:hypothetical protein